jgi:hypothetical protein
MFGERVQRLKQRNNGSQGKCYQYKAVKKSERARYLLEQKLEEIYGKGLL